MRVYVGRTHSKKLNAQFQQYGWGEMVTPREWPPTRPYALDNGAFSAWRAGRSFDEDRFQRTVAAADDWPVRPDFIVAPDIVGGGERSLDYSLSWVERIHICPVYLAVQPGMTPDMVMPLVDPFAGLFVGGGTKWAFQTGEGWAALAHGSGLQCHVGRVGTARRVRWAHMAGVDSIDSCQPLKHPADLEVFRAALSTCRHQQHFFFARV